MDLKTIRVDDRDKAYPAARGYRSRRTMKHRALLPPVRPVGRAAPARRDVRAVYEVMA